MRVVFNFKMLPMEKKQNFPILSNSLENRKDSRHDLSSVRQMKNLSLFPYKMQLVLVFIALMVCAMSSGRPSALPMLSYGFSHLSIT